MQIYNPIPFATRKAIDDSAKRLVNLTGLGLGPLAARVNSPAYSSRGTSLRTSGGRRPFLGGLSSTGKGMGNLIKMGNVRVDSDLADYINTPGTPGSSTFWLYGLADDGTDDSTAPATSFIPNIVQSISSAAGQIIPAVATWQLAQANVQRAQQGLPPLTAAQYTPQPAQSSPILPIALIGALGIGLLMFLRRR